MKTITYKRAELFDTQIKIFKSFEINNYVLNNLKVNIFVFFLYTNLLLFQNFGKVKIFSQNINYFLINNKDRAQWSHLVRCFYWPIQLFINKL